MAYRFQRKEPVSKAIPRLGRERIEHALDCLRHCDRAEAIHCARKDIKKVRAVVRLARNRIAKKESRRLGRSLREAASRLAGLRDAHMKIQTMRRVARHFKEQLAPEVLRKLRADLRKGCEEEMKRFGSQRTSRVVDRTLRRIAKTLQRLKVGGKGWKVISPGVKTAYYQGRQAYRTVLKDPSPENFHEWRKRAKDLWYQARLLHPVRPEQMKAMADELESLAESLGNDHDLFVLRLHVDERCPRVGNTRQGATLKRSIEQWQREFREAALVLGARFYAEKPAHFCERLRGYWQTWRSGRKPAISHARTP